MQMKTLAIFVALALSASFGAQAAGVTNAMLESAGKDNANVLNWGISQDGQRFSPLTQVNTKNVSKLVPAWSFPLAARSSAARSRSR
jgi:alcohol dehydrogenase (cytochrome c)